MGLTSQGIQIHTRVINNDYEGKLKVMVSITLPWKVSKGDRIAQLLILPYMGIGHSDKKQSSGGLEAQERLVFFSLKKF